MVHDEPGTAPIEPCTGTEMETTIMYFNLKAQNETDDTATMANNCYASTTWKTRLQPEDSAGYACRWMYDIDSSLIENHMATNHYTFGEFVAIHDLLDHKPNDRGKILSRLRTVPRRHETKSSQGPSLRPVFVALYDEYQTENLIGIPDLEQDKCDLPAFVSIPTIHFHTLDSQSFPENPYHVKSLLQYHYRFRMHNKTDQKSEFDHSSILDGIRSRVREMWCLALDSTALRIAMPEYIQKGVSLLQKKLESLKASKGGKIVAVLVVLLGIIGQVFSAVVPGGWLLDGLFRKVEKHILGLDFMELIRFASFMLVFSRSDKNKTKTMNRMNDWVFSPLRTFLAFSAGRYDGKPVRNLSALDEHMNHWIEAEASEEVAQALRNLLSIAIRFTMNFHLSPDRDIFQLDRPSLWRRIMNYIRHDSKATSAKTELLYKPSLRAQSPETLQDLEDELTAAISNIDRHHGTAQSELQASRDDENKNMLSGIQSFGDNLSLGCLLRMCTISTPTRFSITSQDITDMFSRRISRLEWLIQSNTY
ncbi:uncharacterized protein FFUJ_11411 [Fusarium fujikuroi IMI 58289]|uniref:Uncharacterized protein n=1 Tax=Gibberella fujikuroi (strain CBS 195.34 / IMI 58289 / NRRL A-6831) TaxID=1279085 RepID=S0EMR8_GIBF5|nr:uncharacterized protein FFUJ_11411 [Fusarium fujikuroi IMI 58289]CCT76091.1 uncharacterized protein FFUJ_11411 [Fusarium fujikuroi IMI 58289]